MNIRFGTTASDEPRATMLGFVVFLVGALCSYFQVLLSWSHRLIVDSQLSNETSSKFIIPCGFPYENYSCSVLSMTPNISQYCLNDVQITSVRFLPLLLLVLELCIIHELFSFSEDCVRFFFYAFGIVSVFVFGVICILIYHDTCTQSYITTALFLTGGILYFLSFYNMTVHNDRRRYARGND